MDTWVRPVTKLSTQLLKTLWPTTVKFSIKISILSIALTRREHLYTAYECEQHIWQRLKFHVLFLEAFGLQPAKYMVFKDIVCCISSKIEIIGLGYFARLLSMYELLCPTIGYELLRPTVFLRAWGTSLDDFLWVWDDFWSMRAYEHSVLMAWLTRVRLPARKIIGLGFPMVLASQNSLLQHAKWRVPTQYFECMYGLLMHER